jgi:Flp pilus assembly protein TadD
MPAQPRRRRASLADLFLPVCLILSALGFNIHAQQVAPQVSAEREQGIKLFQQGDTAGAIKALRVATKESKEDSAAWHYLGVSLNRTGDLKGARFESFLE